MNFFGLHTYPEGRPNAEPTVWIGPPDEIGEGSEVKAAYASSYFTTLRGNWGYEVKPTGDYAHGAGWLFHRGGYGSDVMEDLAPQPWNAEDARTLFARAADVLRDAFTFARRLGTKTCAGTETPLVVPKAVADRLSQAGRRLDDLETTQLLYEGMFRRIAQTYPLDYFWLWTPEGWTWEGVKDEEVRATVEDLRRAILAAQKVKAPFSLATCGWVLGPPQDRTLFDRELPKDVALSCINRTVGHSPVERGFAAVKGRPAWAIPWLEDDPSLTSPQLWVGRMRRDAADARRYGATGLIGIHWRTRVLGPNVQALAQAAWRQDWPQGPPAVEGPVGGYPLVRAAANIAGAAEPAVYRDQRCGLTGYRLRVPKGRYAVTLRFAEMERTRAGERVFDITVEGRTTASGIDLAKSPGAGSVFDHVARDVVVTDGWLDVGFVDHQNVPCLAAIELEGAGVKRRINVGGPPIGGYEADLPGVPFVATGDFWRAWAEAEFGSAAGSQAAPVFEGLDSRLPQPATWIEGPGGLDPDDRPWTEAKADYAFVDELEALRPLVRGACEPRALRLLARDVPLHARDGRAPVRVGAAADGRGGYAVRPERKRPQAESRGRARPAASDGPAHRACHGAPLRDRQHARRARHCRQLAAARAATGLRAAGPGDRAGPRPGAPGRRASRSCLPGPRASRRAGGPDGAGGRRAAPARGHRSRRSEGPLPPTRLAADGHRLVERRLPSATAHAASGGSSLPSPGGDFEYAVEAVSAAGTALRVPAGGRDAPRTVVVVP